MKATILRAEDIKPKILMRLGGQYFIATEVQLGCVPEESWIHFFEPPAGCDFRLSFAGVQELIDRGVEFREPKGGLG